MLLPLHLAVELHATWDVGTLVDAPVLCEIVPALHVSLRAIAPLLMLAASFELSALVRRYRRLGLGPRALLEESALAAAAATSFEKRFQHGYHRLLREAVASRKSRARWTVAIACGVAFSVNAIDTYFWRYNYQTRTCEVRPDVQKSGDRSLFRIYQWSAEGFFFVVVPLISLLVNACSVYDVRKLSALSRANDRVSNWVRRSCGLPVRTDSGRQWTLQASTSLVVCLSFYVTFTAVPRTAVWALASFAEQSRDFSMTEAEAAADEAGWQRYLFYALVRKTLDELHLSSYALGALVCALASRRVRRRLRLMLICVHCCGDARTSMSTLRPPPPPPPAPPLTPTNSRPLPARPPRPAPPDPRLLLGVVAPISRIPAPSPSPIRASSRESVFLRTTCGAPVATSNTQRLSSSDPNAKTFAATAAQASRESLAMSNGGGGMPISSHTSTTAQPTRRPSPTFRGILRRARPTPNHVSREMVASAGVGKRQRDEFDAHASVNTQHNPNDNIEYS